jgi:hypothetical protein
LEYPLNDDPGRGGWSPQQRPSPQFPTALSAALKSTLLRAIAYANRRKHQYATLEHLLLRDRDRAYRERERRYCSRYDDDWRYRRGDRGCRDVTIRERRGDEVVVKHVRRCD